jgi:hypothetical protein
MSFPRPPLSAPNHPHSWLPPCPGGPPAAWTELPLTGPSSVLSVSRKKMTVLPITPRSYFSSTPKSSHSLSGSFARSPLPALHHKEGWSAGEPVATGAASSDATGAASSSSVTWHSLVRTVSCNAFKGGGAMCWWKSGPKGGRRHNSSLSSLPPFACFREATTSTCARRGNAKT